MKNVDSEITLKALLHCVNGKYEWDFGELGRHNPMKKSDSSPHPSSHFPPADLFLVATRSRKANREKLKKTAAAFCRFVWSRHIELFFHLLSCDVDVYHTCNTELTGRKDRCHGSIRKGLSWTPSSGPPICAAEYSWLICFNLFLFPFIWVICFQKVQA